jgi:predicted DNA-binding transcriptional regulator AlpA
LAFIGHLDANDDDDVDGDTFSGKPDPDGHNVVLMWADDADLFSDSDTVRDLETALSYLSEEQASMYALLETHQNLPAACKASGVSAATFYRRVSELQMHLRMFGFKSAA